MQTNESKIDKIIKARAINQFMRDILRLRELLDHCGGSLDLHDIQRMFLEDCSPKMGFLKKIFNRSSNVACVELESERSHLLKLAFKIIDDEGLNELTLEEIENAKLKRLYYEHFHEEYENYERIQYQVRDILLMERAERAILDAKKKNNENADEFI